MQKTVEFDIHVKLQRGIGKLKRKEEQEMRKLSSDKLKRIYAARKFEKARRAVRPYALKAGIRTDEDVFREFKRHG